MWTSFLQLFAEMSALTAVFFIVGIVLCVIEMFMPGFGVCGISGMVMLALGIILRMVNGGDIYMFFIMIFFVIVIIGGMLLLMSHSIKKGALSKTKIFDVGTSVPEGLTEGTKDYSSLIGKSGKVVTYLHPVGVADFDGQSVDVMAKNGIIDQGKVVKVVYVEGQKVVVEEISE